MRRFPVLLILILAFVLPSCRDSVPTTTLTPSQAWSARARMPSARSEMPAVLLDGRIYVPGGFGNRLDQASAQTLEAYNPLADSWIRLAPLPAGRHHLMAAGLDGLLYTFGGACIPGCGSGSDSAWVYDPAADAWRELAPMPEARSAGAAVALDGFIYIVGGAGGTADLLRYDPRGDSWNRLAPLTAFREHTAAVTLDGEIYALAGRWQGELDSVEIYNPAADAWRLGPPMAEPRSGHGAAVLDGQIYVLGGEVVASGPNFGLLDSVEIFDPVAGQWRAGPTLPVGLHGFPAVVFDGTLYALGGATRAGAVANLGDVYAWIP